MQKAHAKAIHICSSHKLTHKPKTAKKYVLPTHHKMTGRQCVTIAKRNAGNLQNIKIIATFEYRQI
jgi:hypothetical protein